MNEQWKVIDDYFGKYEISNFGRIRKLGRLFNGLGKSGIKYYEKPIYLQPFDNGHGYKVIGLSKGKNTKKNYYIHRLVAEYFIDNPDNKNNVNHIDYDRSNNNVSNLEWCTQDENIKHSLSNMCGVKKCIPTNTGHRYISKRKDREVYRVTYMVEKKEKEKNFNTIEKAIEFRKTIYGF